MSTRFPGGTDPQDNHPENFGSGTYGTPDYGASDPTFGYNGYGSEQNSDFAAFDVNAAAAGHGASQFHGTTLVDGTYGDGAQLHPVNDPQANGWMHLKGTGKMNALEAWGFGFKQTFANWKLWIVIGLLAVVVPFVASLIFPLLGSLAQIAVLFLAPFVYSFALLQTLSRHWKYDGLKSPTYGSTLGMMVLIGVIVSVVFLVFFLVSALIFGGSALEAMRSLDPVQIENDPMAILPALGAIMGMLGLTLFLLFLLSPLFMFQYWYAADNAGSFGTCLSEGFKAGTRNYGQLLLFGLISVLLSVAIIFTLGLGAIVVTPASILAMAYAYRQVSGGPVPTESPNQF